MGLNRIIYSVIFSVLIAGSSACVKEIALDTEDNTSYIFVDGNIVVGDVFQRIIIGRTDGVGTAVPIPIRQASVSVKDYTNQQEYFYQEIASGEYVVRLFGELETNYQLFIELQNGEIFSTDTIRLKAEPLLTFSGTVAPRVRVDPAGDSIVTNAATATVRFQTPPTSSEDLLVVRSRFEFSVSDLVCNPFDSAVKCYYKDDITVDEFGILDLSRFDANEPGKFQTGNFNIDARMAEESVLIVDMFRADKQAKPYYRSIASAVALGGDFFSPQPLTIPGNVVETQIGLKAALGYFGVVERTELVLSAYSPEIDRRAGLAFCDGGNADFVRWDCCFCFRNPGASTARPSYWP